MGAEDKAREPIELQGVPEGGTPPSATAGPDPGGTFQRSGDRGGSKAVPAPPCA